MIAGSALEKQSTCTHIQYGHDHGRVNLIAGKEINAA